MNAPVTPPIAVPPYKHTPLFPLGKDDTQYRKISSDGVRVEKVLGQDMLVVEREAIRALSEAAFTDINHLLRPAHLKQLRGEHQWVVTPRTAPSTGSSTPDSDHLEVAA